MMEAYVQAGFGAPLGAETLAAIKRFGYDGVRLEVSGAGLVEEVVAAGLKAFALAKRVSWMSYVPPGTPIEFAPCEPPEPDVAGLSPDAYAVAISAALDAADRRQCVLWVGAIGNLNKRGLKYLEALLEALERRHERRWFGISVHRYPHGGSARQPHPGFKNRMAEVLALRDLIGLRSWGVTEFGYHTARRPSSKWWRPSWLGFSERWSDEDVKRLVAEEWQFWQYAGARMATIYQINDGPGESRLDRYGLRDFNGRWKPVANVRELRQKGSTING